jgi:hypothetical protein
VTAPAAAPRPEDSAHVAAAHMTDRAALDVIAHTLDGREWEADTLDAIADLVRATGRLVRDVGDGLPSYRVSFENFDYNHIDGEEAMYGDGAVARVAFTDAVLSPPDGAATVALWTRGGDDEWMLVGSCDLLRLAQSAD